MSSPVQSLQRVLIMAEMHGRDLTRRHVALGLLVALPLSFYLSSNRHSSQALSAGGIGMAFAVSGATLFSVLSSQNVDQRLVLGGYRPVELLLGRLLFLGPLGLVIAAGFSGLMSVLSHPTQPWVLVLGVALVALQSVPFGLAVGSALSNELEGTLVLIGVVGMQLAVGPDAAIAKVLPFYGPRRLIETAGQVQGAIVGPVLQTIAYGAVLLVVARLFMNRRIAIERHHVITPPDPFDAKAATWDDDPAKIERARVIADAIAGRVELNATTRLLEYGAGTGLVTQALRDRVGPVTLADTSAGMRSVIQAKIDTGALVDAKVWSLDLATESPPDGRFDLVLTVMTLHHIADLDTVLRRFAQLLAPDGTLGIVDLEEEDGSFHGDEFGGHRGFRRSDLEAQLRAAGFDAITYEICHHVERHDTRYPLFLLTCVPQHADTPEMPR